jgi:hypothetical protein
MNHHFQVQIQVSRAAKKHGYLSASEPRRSYPGVTRLSLWDPMRRLYRLQKVNAPLVLRNRGNMTSDWLLLFR